MIPLFKVYMDPSAQDRVNKTLYSGFVGEGPRVKDFEEVLSSILKTDRVLALNSATSGLEMACHMADESGNGFKFLTTPLTCTATNWPLIRRRFWPTWVDVDPTTLNMDMDDLRAKVKDAGWSLAGIMLTHWAGRPHDMDAILQIKAEFEEQHGRRLVVIEDCAHAFGGFYKGQPLGTFGDFGVYSFQAVKPLTTGDGGCFISKSQEDHDRARLLRWYGIDRANRDADIVEPGYKFHMNDIAASIGLANIVPALRNTNANARNAFHFDFYLKDVDGFKPLAWPDRTQSHPYWLYTVLVDRREDFHRAMKDRGIETGIVHRRNDHYACMEGFEKELPNLDSIYDKITHIPVGWWLTDDDRDHIVSSVLKGW